MIRSPRSLLFVFATLTAGLFLTGCATPPEPQSESMSELGGGANKPIIKAWTKIVRGSNACPLIATNIGNGNSPGVGKNQPLTNLSVNASDDKSVTFGQLAAGLPNAHYGYTTLGDLRKINKHVQLVRDPLPGNPYHCLLSVITPAQFVTKTKCK